MARTTQIITLPSTSIGTKQSILVHRYFPANNRGTKTAYVQASLHADELPGPIVPADFVFLYYSSHTITCRIFSMEGQPQHCHPFETFRAVF